MSARGGNIKLTCNFFNFMVTTEEKRESYAFSQQDANHNISLDAQPLFGDHHFL